MGHTFHMAQTHSFHYLRRLIVGVLPFILCACASQDEQVIPSNVADIVDFSGHWEKDYQLSDDFNNKFNLFLFDLRRGVVPSQLRGVNQGVASASGTPEAIMGLARFTEEVTRVPLLEITQDDDSVLIEREDDLPLNCQYFDQQFVRTGNTFGSELCGWNGEQLLFQMNLSDGLNIFHRVTLGPDRQQLNITTTVSSAQVGTAFTISNYYSRFSPPENDFNCVFTLTRNNVCSQNRNRL